MEINNNGIADLSLNKPNNVIKAEQTQNDTTEVKVPSFAPSSELALSNAGKLTQDLDKTSQEIDQILAKHLSPEQKKELNAIYQKLEKEFESGNGSASSEKKIENLFEQAHNILDSSVDKLSTNERKQVDGLVEKMDGLENQLSALEEAEFGGGAGYSGGGAREQGQGQDVEVGSAQGSGKKKKNLSVAELNSLSAAELNKLPAHLLKKLNAQQLNKLNASQLNLLPENLLSKLNPSNLAKVQTSST